MKKQRSIVINESQLLCANIMVQMPCYPMTEDKFKSLMKNGLNFSEFAKNILMIGIGLCIKILCVFIMVIYQAYHNMEITAFNEIEKWEYISLIICAIITTVSFIIGKFYKTEKDKACQEIMNFFIENKKQGNND